MDLLFFMKIFFYLKEIKNRFFILFCNLLFNFFILFYYRDQLIYILIQSHQEFFNNFMCTNLTEIFFTFLKLTALLAFYFSYPILLLQLILFFVPALYSYEYQKIKLIVLNSFFLYCLCNFLTYKIFLPLCLNFFFGLQLKGDDVLMSYELETGLKVYTEFFLQILYTLLLIFHCFFLFLYYLYKINLKHLIYYRKIIYIFNFTLATIFSPPDIGSQLFLGILLIFFFEVFLIFAFISNQYKTIYQGK